MNSINYYPHTGDEKNETIKSKHWNHPAETYAEEIRTEVEPP